MPSFSCEKRMTKLELSPRLQAVASWVPVGARLADIGTDHAYLPVSLILAGKVSAAIAADVRQGPLDHAKRTAGEYGVTDKLRFCLCDGLTGIDPSSCDVITIAGMGGETIARILAAAPWAKQGHLLLLQPQSTQNVLRSFLSDNGYTIMKEWVVREGNRWYPILAVQGGVMEPLSCGEIWCGRAADWIEQPERVGYLDWLLRRTQAQLDGLARSRVVDTEKKDELSAIVDFLQEQISRLNQKIR